jgi:hypothetical protein
MRRHGAQAGGWWQGLGNVHFPRRGTAEEQTDEEQTKPVHGGLDQWRFRLKFQDFMPSTASSTRHCSSGSENEVMLQLADKTNHEQERAGNRFVTNGVSFGY